MRWWVVALAFVAGSAVGSTLGMLETDLLRLRPLRSAGDCVRGTLYFDERLGTTCECTVPDRGSALAYYPINRGSAGFVQVCGGGGPITWRSN